MSDLDAIARESNRPLIYAEDSPEHRKVVEAQTHQASCDGARVTCACGTRIKLWMAYRCLYCGLYMCQSCAEKHFGKTREQYAEERRAKIREVNAKYFGAGRDE